MDNSGNMFLEMLSKWKECGTNTHWLEHITEIIDNVLFDTYAKDPFIILKDEKI